MKQDYIPSEAKSISYRLNPELRNREPGDDDGPVSSLFPAFSGFSDVSFDPSTFEKRPTLPVQLELNYLDKYAQIGGGQKEEETRGLTEAEIRSEIAGETARSTRCLNQAAHFTGSESEDFYHHVLNCRKAWCPICGGKNGVIAKTRKKAIRDKFNYLEYGIIQIIFTTPMEIRQNLQSRDKLNSFLRDAKQVTAKYYGDPSKTKRKSNGEVKEYSLGNELVIGYLHVFGDPDKKGVYREGTAGTFNPHANVQIFRKSDNLYVAPDILRCMKDDMKMRFRKYGYVPVDENGNEKEIDIHVSYLKQSAKDRKKNHRIKYMVKPPLHENFEKVKEEDNIRLEYFIKNEMKGFRYIRFWGGLSQLKKAFREEAGIYPANIEEIENRIEEELIFRNVTEWNLKSFLEADDLRESQGKDRKFKRIAENFYREKL